jgi:CIC family chloride channel protein
MTSWRLLVRFLLSHSGEHGWFIIVLAGLIGVGGAFAIILFNLLIEVVGSMWSSGAGAGGLSQDSRWLFLLTVPAGLLAARALLRLAGAPDGEMVPDLVHSVVRTGGRLGVLKSASKLLAAVFTLGSGGSLGAEGPVAVAGGTIGSGIGRFLRFGPRRTSVFLACGAAAGAPIAGALFALEVVLGTFAAATLSPVIVASVVSALVSHAYLGDSPAFQVPTEFSLAFFRELPLYVLLGLACGVMAALFVQAFFRVQDFMRRYLGRGVGLTLVAGAAVAMAGMYSPHLLGPGRGAIRLMLFGELAGVMALSLGILKILTTSATMAGGGAGGVFTPSLFVGASVGSFFGLTAQSLFPQLGVTPEAYALVGMASALSGATFAPLTAILIVIEMTGSYSLIPPLMLGCVISYLVSRRLNGESIYTLALKRKGERIRQGFDRSVLERVLVKECYNRDPDVLSEQAPLAAVIQRMSTSRQTAFPVVDSELNLAGLLSYEELSRVLGEESLLGLLVAADLAYEEVETVCPEDTLYDALRIIGRRDASYVPVVEGAGSLRLLGLLGREDIMGAYQTHLLLDVEGSQAGNGNR